MKQKQLSKLFLQILKIDLIRNLYCWIRFFFLKKHLKILPKINDAVGEHTLVHNIGALSFFAAFGMGNRMALLIYPLAAVLRNMPDAKILIVGPRTEDDIFWARSLGLNNVKGLDLFSYSPWIDIGDIHSTSYDDQYFDAVILGWVISYSEKPEVIVKECKRILKLGGYLGFGIESDPEQRVSGNYGPPRVNDLNSCKDIVRIVMEPVVFIHDPQINISTDNAVLFKLA